MNYFQGGQGARKLDREPSFILAVDAYEHDENMTQYGENITQRRKNLTQGSVNMIEIRVTFIFI